MESNDSGFCVAIDQNCSGATFSPDPPKTSNPFTRQVDPREEQIRQGERTRFGVIRKVHNIFQSKELGDEGSYPCFEVFTDYDDRKCLVLAVGPRPVSLSAREDLQGRILKAGAHVNFSLAENTHPNIPKSEFSRQKAFEFDRETKTVCFCFKPEPREPLYVQMFVTDPTRPQGQRNMEDMYLYYVFDGENLVEISRRDYFRARDSFNRTGSVPTLYDLEMNIPF